MSKSMRIREAEWRALAQLQGELSDRPVVDIEANLRFLLDGLCRLLGASRCSWLAATRQDAGPEAAADPLNGWRPVVAVAHPGNQHFERMVQAFMRQNRSLTDPHVRAMAHSAGSPRSFIREQVVDDRAWNRSPVVQELMRPMGLDGQMVSGLPLSDTVEVFLAVYRSAKEKRFTEHDRDLLLQGLQGARFLQRRAARFFGLTDSQSVFTPRERSLVALLLQGLSEKQIATRLELTTGSTHQAATRLYRKCGVNGRIEFMARWLNS